MCSRCSNWKLSSKLGNQLQRDHFVRQPLASHPDQRNTERSAPWGQWRVPAWWLPPTRRRCWHCWDPRIGSTRTCHKIGAIVGFRRGCTLLGFPKIYVYAFGRGKNLDSLASLVPQQKTVHRAFGSFLKYPNLMALRHRYGFVVGYQNLVGKKKVPESESSPCFGNAFQTRFLLLENKRLRQRNQIMSGVRDAGSHENQTCFNSTCWQHRENEDNTILADGLVLDSIRHTVSGLKYQ